MIFDLPAAMGFPRLGLIYAGANIRLSPFTVLTKHQNYGAKRRRRPAMHLENPMLESSAR
jgi:hypothetical protein